MNKDIIIKELEALLNSYTAVLPIDHNSDIMGEPLLLSERDAASFLLDVEKAYKIDLNKLIPDLFVYSIDTVANRLLELVGENNVCRV
jgi:hypothetical protein